MRGRLLHGFGFVLSSARGVCRGACGGGAGRGALVRDERSGARARRLHRAWRGRSASGPIARPRALARARARRARAAGRGAGRSLRGRSAGHAARVARRSRCFISGLVGRARATASARTSRARDCWMADDARSSHIWYDALFEVRLGNAERVAALADEMQRARRRIRARARSNRVSVVSRLGGRPDGTNRATAIAAFERRTKTTRGSECSRARARPGVRHRSAAARRRLERSAKSQLDEALQFASTLGERVYLPQLFLLEAAIARAAGTLTRLDASVRSAIAEARAQEAPWLELMALIDLCEHGGETAKDRRSLAALVDQLPEANDTAAVAKARDLLGRANVEVDAATRPLRSGDSRRARTTRTLARRTRRDSANPHGMQTYR